MNIRVTLKEFAHNHVVQWLFILMFILNSIALGVVFWAVPPQEGTTVILHHNASIGIDFASVSPWYMAYILPSVGFVLMLFHLILAYVFFARKRRITTHFILLATVLIQLGVIIASVSVALVNKF